MHNKLELLFCLDGEIEVTCGKHKKTLKQNGFAFIMPYTVHSYETVKYSKTIIITILKECLPAFHKYFNREPAFPFVENVIHPDVDYITKRLSSKDRGTLSFEQLIGYIYIFLSIIFKEIEFEEVGRKGSTDLLPDVLSFIEKNFREELTLENIAFEVGMNPSYLSRVFSDKIGYPITRYINEVRIDYAKFLLLSSSQPITDIAFSSGFKSIRTFNRVFQEHTNTTPKEYRTNKNKTEQQELLTTRHIKDVLTTSGIPASGKLTFYKT